MGLVDHEPHAPIRHQLPLDPGDQVVRHPVRLEFLAKGIRRPGDRKADPFDGVHLVDVGDVHRCDADGQGEPGYHVPSPARMASTESAAPAVAAGIPLGRAT